MKDIDFTSIIGSFKPVCHGVKNSVGDKSYWSIYFHDGGHGGEPLFTRDQVIEMLGLVGDLYES